MTDGSDGNDERPSDADAAPESSDDAVTSGDDDAAPDEDDASESPATDDGADSSDSTPDDEGSTEIADTGDGADAGGGAGGGGGGDDAEDAEDAEDADGTDDDSAEDADGTDDDSAEDADDSADDADDSAEPSNPQPEAALDPSATPPAAGNGTAGKATTRETAGGADADAEADTTDDSSDGDEDGGGGLGHVPDDEWEGNASGVTENYADAKGGRVEDDADADGDQPVPGDSDQPVPGDGDQPVPGDSDQPVPGEPERDVAGVADDRMVDTTAAEAAEEEDAPIAGEALTERPETPPEQRAEGEAPLAEDVVGGDAGGPGVEDDSEGLFGSGPETDEEMPLTVHIEEMMYRLGAVFAVAGIVVFSVLLVGNSTAGIPSTEEIIIFLWDSHVDFQNYKPYVYGPLEFLLTKLKVASLAGLIVALPVFVYQTYGFMRPGLYPHERRYYLAAIPTSLVLALVGVAFAHFLVLPAIFQYFISYTEVSAELAFGLRETFNLILLLMGYMAIVFQIPLFIQLATMMGVVTREWLEDRRLIFWGSFLGISFVVSPDPTGMSPIIVAATMVVLFEGTLALLRWTGN